MSAKRRRLKRPREVPVVELDDAVTAIATTTTTTTTKQRKILFSPPQCYSVLHRMITVVAVDQQVTTSPSPCSSPSYKLFNWLTYHPLGGAVTAITLAAADEEEVWRHVFESEWRSILSKEQCDGTQPASASATAAAALAAPCPHHGDCELKRRIGVVSSSPTATSSCFKQLPSVDPKVSTASFERITLAEIKQRIDFSNSIVTNLHHVVRPVEPYLIRQRSMILNGASQLHRNIHKLQPETTTTQSPFSSSSSSLALQAATPRRTTLTPLSAFRKPGQETVTLNSPVFSYSSSPSPSPSAAGGGGIVTVHIVKLPATTQADSCPVIALLEPHQTLEEGAVTLLTASGRDFAQAKQAALFQFQVWKLSQPETLLAGVRLAF